MLSDNIIRTILPSDNPELAKIIRNTLAEFGAANPGTVLLYSAGDCQSPAE